MKTTKKMQRLYLDKNTTRYRKMSGGSNKSGNTQKSRFSMFSTIGKRLGIGKKNATQPTQPRSTQPQNRFPKTSKFFRGVGKKFGLSKEKPKQRLIGAVDVLVTEIKKFNDKTKNFAQYGITVEEDAELKKAITSTFAGIPVPSVSKVPTLAEIVIPNGTNPGQIIKANVNGQIINVKIPPDAFPGTTIRFEVPNK
jgi:hypothetical protein